MTINFFQGKEKFGIKKKPEMPFCKMEQKSMTMKQLDFTRRFAVCTAQSQHPYICESHLMEYKSMIFFSQQFH